MTKRVLIDREKCCGNLECVAIAPTLFSYDEEGLAVAEQSDVPDADMSAAQEAVAACPVQAIRLID